MPESTGTLYVLADTRMNVGERIKELLFLLSPAAHQISEVSEQVGDFGGNREGEDPAKGICVC